MIHVNLIVGGHGEQQCLHLAQVLKLQKNNFQLSLIPDLTYIHESAACSTGISITCVEYKKNNVYTLQYYYEWSLFNDCLDLNEDGIHYEKVDFSINESGIVLFDLSIFQ